MFFRFGELINRYPSDSGLDKAIRHFNLEHPKPGAPYSFIPGLAKCNCSGVRSR